MSTPNDYDWLRAKLINQLLVEKDQSRNPNLTLITPDSPLLKTRKPKMKTTPDREAKKEETARIIKEAIPPAAPHNSPLYRKLSSLKLVDHVGMVHNALEAVRCLAIPCHGTGYQPSGAVDGLVNVGRNHFVDLLEIINDRLGAALEIEEAQS